MAKYMLIMRGTDEGRADYEEMDFSEVIAAMGRYNEQMMDAGVLSAGEGLADAAEGAVVDFSGETPVVSDGPYGETKELFNGFWILDVASQDEALEWAKRAPLSGPGTKLEVRRVHGPEDFPADDEWIVKEKQWRAELGTE
ncbi:YciI family protein [Isoptericola dokdonensis]|uniref:YCII-related domain protein n=1 Tax=Isoptericola dokdonensis DS-3 TaxID=1300344 RepID=A0A161IKM4_9MICO|nr:YciI family protein [Isoptericola dokdonensis]ANC32754.1 YCII-related domain protein [Isoptericola dokdonensis DS-3]